MTQQYHNAKKESVNKEENKNLRTKKINTEPHI